MNSSYKDKTASNSNFRAALQNSRSPESPLTRRKFAAQRTGTDADNNSIKATEDNLEGCKVIQEDKSGTMRHNRAEFPINWHNIVYCSQCSALQSPYILGQRHITARKYTFEDSGDNNKVKLESYAQIYSGKSRFRGNNNFVHVGERSNTSFNTSLYGNDNQIIIGKNCRINKAFIAVSGNSNIIEIADNAEITEECIFEIEGSNCRISISSGSKVSDSSFNIKKGVNCEISFDRNSKITGAFFYAQSNASIVAEAGCTVKGSAVMTAAVKGSRKSAINYAEDPENPMLPWGGPVFLGENAFVEGNILLSGGTNLDDMETLIKRSEDEPEYISERSVRAERRAMREEYREDLWRSSN